MGKQAANRAGAKPAADRKHVGGDRPTASETVKAEQSDFYVPTRDGMALVAFRVVGESIPVRGYRVNRPYDTPFRDDTGLLVTAIGRRRSIGDRWVVQYGRMAEGKLAGPVIREEDFDPTQVSPCWERRPADPESKGNV